MSDDDQRDAQHSAEYRAWLADVESGGVTPPLREYLRWERYDSNVGWRLGAGHVLNLLDQATEALDDIAEIVDPAWLAGRILPRMIGAEEMAQVAAIRAVLAQDDTGTTDVSENAEHTPPR